MSEHLITASAILDAEFNHRDGLGCFIEKSGGDLWLFSIDAATGALVPADGRGTHLDQYDASASDFGNGPEWVFGGNFDAQIVYTKYLTVPPDPTLARNGRVINIDGSWIPALLDTTVPACIQLASPTGKPSLGGDFAPRLHWSAPAGVAPNGHYWRPLDTAGYSQIIPGSAGAAGGITRRSVDGSHKLIWGQSPAMGGNVFTFDTDTGATEQLTFLTGGQFVDDAFMWPEPTLSNEYLFFATVNLGTHHELRVYRKLIGTWTVINTITAPSGLRPFIWSPEPFIRAGASYVFAELSPSAGGALSPFHTEIGVASLLGASTLTEITDGSYNFRNDPEFYPYGTALGDGSVKIWYNRYDVGGGSQGIYAADTGIM